MTGLTESKYILKIICFFSRDKFFFRRMSVHAKSIFSGEAHLQFNDTFRKLYAEVMKTMNPDGSIFNFIFKPIDYNCKTSQHRWDASLPFTFFRQMKGQKLSRHVRVCSVRIDASIKMNAVTFNPIANDRFSLFSYSITTKNASEM